MKKYLFHLLFCSGSLCVSSFIIKAQAQIAIQGRITDSLDNSPVHNVTVAEIDADGRTLKADKSDINGNFSLRIASRKHMLTISHISFKSKEVSIGDRTVFNISLQSSLRELGDIVIIAQRRSDNGMIAVAERNLTTSQSQISAKDLEEMQAASIDQALQGRLPGLDITASSGDPGAPMQIRIRGTTSINSSNDPLIVVDGMPYETSIPSDFNFGTADDVGYAQLLNISPSDISNISILKDAAATAIWGSRAASGVVVITTKRGIVSKPVLTYTFKGSIQQIPEPLPMLTGNQYSTLIPEAYQNPAGIPLPQSFKEFQYDPNDPYWFNNYSKNSDWLGAISQRGIIQDHNISMSGGGEKARYFASMGYYTDKGITIGNELSRITTTINLDYIVSQKIRFRSDFRYSYTDNDRSYVNNIRDIAYRKMPNMSVYEYDEFGNNTGNFFSPAFNIQGQAGFNNSGNLVGTFNPLAMASDAKNNIITQRVTPHFRLDYAIKRGVLQAIFDVQFDINNTKNKTFLPQTATGRLSNEPIVNRTYDGDIDVFNVITKSTLYYTPKIKNEKHVASAFMTFITDDKKGTTHQAITTNTASSVLQDPTSPSRTSNTDSRLSATEYQSRSVGLLLDATYSFLDRYLFHASLRGDGNSKFGPGNRYGLFPTASVRWRISGEKFMQRFKSVDDLSLRLSYGASGNAPRNDYGFFSKYEALTNTGIAFSYIGLGGVYPATPELKNLQWETVVQQNLGVDLSMYNRRIIATLDFYKRVTNDMFLPGLALPSVTGFNNIDMNGGSLQNQGFELGLNTVPYKTKSLQINFDFNISSNQNVITEISPLYPSTKGDVTQNGNYQTFLKINNPFGSFYGFKFLGVYPDKQSTVAKDAKGQPIIGPTGQIVYMNFNYPSIGYVFQPGDAMYEDINHDGNINYQDVVYLGNSNPKYTGGFGTTIIYKTAWRLAAHFTYRYDYDVINGTKMNTTNMFTYDNQSTAVLRRWRKEGDVTDIPRAMYRAGYNWLGSDRYVEDASFIRFRTVTLRYTVPKKTTDKMKLKSLSAYVTLDNPYIWTNYTGQDPEVTVRGSDPFRVAMDQSYTPSTKKITLGVSVSF